MVPQEEIDQLAAKFIELKKCSENSNSKKLHREYQEFQKVCVEKLRFLVTQRSNKYKKFSNHLDLEQDGFEALLLALKTYELGKGAFTWWADKYISTRISRAASAHSTIRFPIHRSKELKPHKMSEIPIMTDPRPDPENNTQLQELRTTLIDRIKMLPEQQQIIINSFYGFNGFRPLTIDAISQKLNISRAQVSKILHHSEQQIKEQLPIDYF